MHKHVPSKTTHLLRVHQFTAQQVGKGSKRRNELSLNTKSNCTYESVHSKATYQLRVHQFTTQQVEGGKGRNTIDQVSIHCTKSNLEYASLQKVLSLNNPKELLQF